VSGEHVKIGDKEEAVVMVLHLNKVLQCSKVVAQVQVTGRPYAANNSFHCICFSLVIIPEELSIGDKSNKRE
jgi:hypothetical protein